MATTNFVDQETTVEAAWLNDVDATVYGALAAATTPAEALTALSIDTQAVEQAATEVAVAATLAGANADNVIGHTSSYTGAAATTVKAVLNAINNGLGFPVPVTTVATTYALLATTFSLIITSTASCTVTLEAASACSGRLVLIKTEAAYTVVSASANVIPLEGGAAGTAILAATAGKYALLQSNGTAWVTLMAN